MKDHAEEQSCIYFNIQAECEVTKMYWTLTKGKGMPHGTVVVKCSSCGFIKLSRKIITFEQPQTKGTCTVEC
jgi:hypothetical protein